MQVRLTGIKRAAGALRALAIVSSFLFLYVFKPIIIRCSMDVLRFSLPRVFDFAE